ncbi:MAG TPA: hypothetical protein PLE04_05340 [Syntrophales bacterium]|nr:hypothetical protein [Syntrophales bacterium]
MAAEKSKEKAMGAIPWLSCFSRLWESPRIRDIGAGLDHKAAGRRKNLFAGSSHQRSSKGV